MSDKPGQKTQLYGGSEESKTQTYSSQPQPTETYKNSSHQTQTYKTSDADQEAAKTQTYGDVVTQIRTREHDLGVGDMVELDRKYTITEIISDEDLTLEAVVYKVVDEDNHVYALKLYKEFRDSSNEPKYEALNRIKQISDPDLLKLHCFGVGKNKYKKRFCYEISDFAEGGDLLSVADIKEKYTPEFLKDEVIPQLFKGIKKLHEYKIYHCDLKPQNVFYLDKEQTDLIIGDFGSAKVMDEDSRQFFGRSSTIKSTDIYLAPELAKGVFSEKNDYFSLGMIILHLLYPELIVMKKECDKMTLRINAKKPVIDFNPEYEDFNQLIAGLTLGDSENRWGREEVEKWLQGEFVQVNYGTFTVMPIKIRKKTIQTEEELVKYIEENSDWYEYLVEDDDGFHLLLRWFSDMRDLEEKKIFENMIKYYQQDGVNYVKEAILRYFVPKRPIVIDAKAYQFCDSDDLKSVTQDFIKQIDDIYKITSIDDLKFYFFQLEFVLRGMELSGDENNSLVAAALMEKIHAACDTQITDSFSDFKAKVYPELTEETVLNIIYAFFPDRNFKDLDNKQQHTLEELALFFAEDESRFENKYLKIEKNRFLQKLGHSDWADLSYNNFLFHALREHVKSEIRLNRLEFSADNKTWTVHYLVGYSLTDYLRKKKIKKEIASFDDDESTISIPKKIFTTSRSFFNEFITKFLGKHSLKAEALDSRSKATFYKALKEEIKKHRHELAERSREQKQTLLNMPYLFQSLFFLFPLFILSQFAIALFYPDTYAAQIFREIYPDLAFAGNFSELSQFYAKHIQLINLVVLSSFAPLVFIQGLREKGTVNHALKKYALLSFLLAIAFLIVKSMYPIKILNALSIIFASIFALSLLITLTFWLYKFFPLVSSFLLLSFLFSSLIMKTEVQNLIFPLLIAVLIFETAKLFHIAGKVKIFPLIFAILIYFTGFFYLGGYHVVENLINVLNESKLLNT